MVSDVGDRHFYRKKPVVIEAIQWCGNNETKIASFLGFVPEIKECASFYIDTLEGNMKVNLFDWIIKGIKGERYPCKPDIFEATYDLAFAYGSDNSTEEKMVR